LAKACWTRHAQWRKKDHLHNKSAAICSSLRYDDVLCILLGGDVNLAIAIRNGDLSDAGRSECDGGEESVQHLDSLIMRFGLY
jgi:hypothetical protein